jgi:wyosine [tRNA(Phe)-imidazoG37] synthetase (radical SAM superfamily)
VVTALRAALGRHADIDYLTFSGNGEPTLHPHFPAIVEEVEALRDELAPQARLAIFSNSTTAGREEIRRALARFDAPIMKLDAVEDDLFARIDRPVAGISPAAVVESLEAVPRLVVQTAFIDGALSNYEGTPFEAWVGALQRLHPVHVQIYSTDRPVADPGVQRVLPYVLERLATEARERTGLDVEAYYF